MILLADNLICLSESQLVLAAEYVNEQELNDGVKKMIKLTQCCMSNYIIRELWTYDEVYTHTYKPTN